jgi:glucoamylase
MSTQKFIKIEDHGVLFNNRSAALVSKFGEIDWACFPNFDSDPVFFSILDKEKGGYFTIAPAINHYSSIQYYIEDTNILLTQFFYGDKLVMRISDFLPMLGQARVLLPEIHRKVECLEEKLLITVEFFPFYTQQENEIKQSGETGYIIKSGTRTQSISTDVFLERVGNGLKGTFSMHRGETKWFVTAYGASEAHDLKAFESETRQFETTLFWRDWISKSNYSGPYSEWVKRSLLVLRGLFFDPNYFMAAAPTASLPEVAGGSKNWDYRFMWIRDTAYVIDTLASLGYLEEAMKFFYSLMNQIHNDGGQIKSIYPISNPEAIIERQIDLEGYLNSKPVRFGNAAVEQFQLDQYGSLINAISTAKKYGAAITTEMLELVKETSHTLIKRWKEPDRSIWEIRSGDRHYVYSKAVAWEALNNAILLLKDLETPEEINLLRNTADEIKREVEEKGKDPTGRYYVQYFGSDLVDCALLRLPLIGFCDADSKTFINTLAEIEKRLMRGAFLFDRYETKLDAEHSDNAFLLVSFWYIEDLIQMNKIKMAKEGLEKLLALFNDLHLLSEEIDFKDKYYLGNYPQALSHVGLISTILRLNEYKKVSLPEFKGT